MNNKGDDYTTLVLMLVCAFTVCIQHNHVFLRQGPNIISVIYKFMKISERKNNVHL